MVSAKFTELYNEITTISVESSQEEKLSVLSPTSSYHYHKN
jgi:hypothetical protein